MANSLSSGESIYWDPYTASGVPGPEQLVDLKLSPISLMAAVFGATPFINDFSFMFFMALGMVFFVVTLPFSALGGNTDEAFDEMIAKPTKFTFSRPLGHFYSKY